MVSAEVDGSVAILARALTFGHRPSALQDLDHSIRQFCEIAMQALSPGINDPITAGSAPERFGDALPRRASCRPQAMDRRMGQEDRQSGY